MSIAARSLIRSALGACALAALGFGCNVAAEGESTGATGEAFTGTVHLQCDLWAGKPSHMMPAGNATLRNGGYPGDGGPEVDAFVAEIRDAGGGLGYTIAQSVGGGPSWYAIDVGNDNRTTIANICSESWNEADPVSSGLYSCAASSDFPPPSGPYPHWLAVFDPRGCGSGCL
jgi:hypothetical protein